MESAPMAGKSWQPSDDTSYKEEKQAVIIKQWKVGEKGEGKHPLKKARAQNANAQQETAH